MNKQHPPQHYYCATLGHPGHNQDYLLQGKGSTLSICCFKTLPIVPVSWIKLVTSRSADLQRFYLMR